MLKEALGATIGNDAIHRGWWELEGQRGTRELYKSGAGGIWIKKNCRW